MLVCLSTGWREPGENQMLGQSNESLDCQGNGGAGPPIFRFFVR